MGIQYESLDGAVRSCMIQELDLDLSTGRLYLSLRLNDAGKQEWPETLRKAFLEYDDLWLANALRSMNLLNPSVPRHNHDGSISMTRMPDNAADTLAEGEFNRFYARGLCAQVLSSGGTEVEVYRGKVVQNPRPQSQVMIGKHFQVKRLLEDLRQSIGVEPAMGLPAGPNSGLTVRRLPGT